MPRLMGVVVELTEQARMPSQQTISPYHHLPSSRSQLYSAHSPAGCARAEPRNDSGESADAFRPWGLPTHEVSEQTSPRTSLSHGEASCVQSNVSIWLRRSPHNRT